MSKKVVKKRFCTSVCMASMLLLGVAPSAGNETELSSENEPSYDELYVYEVSWASDEEEMVAWLRDNSYIDSEDMVKQYFSSIGYELKEGETYESVMVREGYPGLRAVLDADGSYLTISHGDIHLAYDSVIEASEKFSYTLI